MNQEPEIGEKKLFWRDGECFVGIFNEDDSEIRELRILRLDPNGSLMSIDAGLGMVSKDAVWDANTLSVVVDQAPLPVSIQPTNKNHLVLLSKAASK